MQINQEKIKNILVVRNDRFGEFLLNIPALRALKETFINSRIIAVVDPYVKELAECIDFIDEIMEWKRKRHSLRDKFQLVFNLKKRNIDMAIMLNPSKELNIFTYLAGIPIRVGYDRKWGFLLTHKIKDKKYLGQKHEVEYNLDLVQCIGAHTEDKSLFIHTSDEDKIAIDSLWKSLRIFDTDFLVAIHPWTSDSIKQWPLENFSRLSQRLLKEFQCKVIIIGGKDEMDRSINFCQENANLINLTGKLTLRQLAALLKRCSFLVSNDSGPVHVSCAVGTPVIAIFRSDIPAKSARRWGPWGEGHTVIEKNNLGDITVDEVLVKIREVLNI